MTWSFDKTNSEILANAQREAAAKAAEAGSTAQLSVPDDIRLQTDSLAKTYAYIGEESKRKEAERLAAAAANKADEARKAELYEAAFRPQLNEKGEYIPTEYSKLANKYGADAAMQIIGRRFYPEKAKTFDDMGKAAFTMAFPAAAVPIVAAGETLHAWKDNEGRGREAQTTAAAGALMGNLSARGLSTVFNPMRPMLRYGGQVASGVFGDMMNENSKRMAEGRPALKDSSDFGKVAGKIAAEEATKKAIDEMVHKVVNSRRWR